MKHCKNYLCELQTCYCDCDGCELMNKGYVAKSEPCQRCGYCEHCGRGGEYMAPYMPILPTWYCYTCRTYHPFGWSCLQYIPATPWIYTLPNTTITYPNTWISNLTTYDIQSIGFSAGNTYTIPTNDWQLDGLNNALIANS